MMSIDELYQQSIADNAKNLRFWQDYLNSLQSLNLNAYAEKLKVPILVPVGSRMFFRGDLKHTNEVIVSLGADYFVKCSLKQAEILRQHRIKDAQSKLDTFINEKNYLENHLSFAKQNVCEKQGVDIFEHHTAQADEIWRKIHRENVKKYKQMEAKERQNNPHDDIIDSELWERLEELELQEELENEMLDNYNEIVDNRKENTFIVNEQNMLLNSFKEEAKQESVIETSQPEYSKANISQKPKEEIVIQCQNTVENKDRIIANEPKSTKVELLQQVLDKQNELENKLYELKYREREQSKTEEDLISKLDEMEQLEELEDEIVRLDVLDANIETDESEESSSKMKKSISFADEDDSETLEITFTHSDTEPNHDAYNPENGITKPSDIYDAHSHLFNNKPTSILKKSKYGEITDLSKEVKKSTKQINFAESENNSETDEPEEPHRTIVISDVVEKPTESQKKIEMGARPTSLFKKKRLQNKVQFT